MLPAEKQQEKSTGGVDSLRHSEENHSLGTVTFRERGTPFAEFLFTTSRLYKNIFTYWQGSYGKNLQAEGAVCPRS